MTGPVTGGPATEIVVGDWRFAQTTGRFEGGQDFPVTMMSRLSDPGSFWTPAGPAVEALLDALRASRAAAEGDGGAAIERDLYASALSEIYDVLDGPTFALRLSQKTRQTLVHQRALEAARLASTAATPAAGEPGE